MDVLLDGCGDKVFTKPVALEQADGKAASYERDPRQITLARLSFPREGVSPEDAARLAAALAVHEPVCLEAFGTPGGIVHQVVCQGPEFAAVSDAIRSTLPGVAVEKIPAKSDIIYSFLEPLRRTRRRPAFAYRDFHLPRPFFLPFSVTGSGIGGLYETLTRVASGCGCLAGWQLLLQPARRSWLAPVRSFLALQEIDTRHSLATGNLVEVRRHPAVEQELLRGYFSALAEKSTGALLAASLRVFAFGWNGDERSLLLGLDQCAKGIRRAFDGYSLRGRDLHALRQDGVDWEMVLHALKNRFSFTSGMILSSAEAASLLPLPPASVVSDRTYPVALAPRSIPVPARLTAEGVRFGVNDHRGVRKPVRIPDELRYRHIYIIGKTGTGKSSLMLNLIDQDLKAGHGVSVFDAEGDLIESAVRLVPEHRIDDVVLFDVGDPSHAIAYNLLSPPASLQRARGVRSWKKRRRDDFVQIFSQTVERMGERMVYLLREAVDAVMGLPDGNLADVERLLTNETFRRWVVAQVNDADVRRFWVEEFPRRRRDFVASIDALVTRLRQIVGEEAVRAVTCQRRGKLDIPSILRERKIFLVNLNFKAVGEAKGSFLGKLLMAELQTAGMARGTRERTPHFIYADEFQNYLCSAFGQILARGRKYELSLCLAHQFTGQLADLIEAILGNAGANVVFQVNSHDAQLLARDFGELTTREMTTSAIFHAWMKVGGDVFSLIREAPDRPTAAWDRQITERSRQTWATPRRELQIEFPSGYRPDAPPEPDAAAEGPAKPSREHKPAPPEPRETATPADTIAEAVPAGEVSPVEPPKPRKTARVGPPEPAPMGRGGQKHVYLQQMVKSAGESLGYRAIIEKPILDGDGSVDVSLERPEHRIACEISVTTPVDHEVANIEKCLAAGYDRIIAVAANARKLQTLQRRVAERFSGDPAERIYCCGPDELAQYLNELGARAASKEDTVRGYKVKVSYRAVDQDDQEARLKSLAKHIASDLRRAKD